MSDQLEGVTEDLVKDLDKKVHDLDAVRKSVEDAASLSGTLWFSYLFALFYIGIAAGGVTHKDLLLENPVKLPFLNVELPLVAFFALAPVLFVISHAYTLMHFVLLAAKAGNFGTELKTQVPSPQAQETREGLRRQLPSNIFVLFLAGPRDIRDAVLGRFLKAVAWISLVIGPVLLLLLLQIQFLTYHLAWVTWVQRFAILTDVLLLWFLWPAVLASRSAIQWSRPKSSVAFGFLLSLSVSIIFFTFVEATFPGEAGTVKEVTLHRTSWFSNTLVLPALDALEAKAIDDQKKLDWIKHTLVLHGRRLEGAVFARADLRKVDFEGAQLQGALFDYANLQEASLDRAEMHGASLKYALLQGASLDGTNLWDASLNNAHLQGALLAHADLRYADLRAANLQGASLYTAHLAHASLDSTLVLAPPSLDTLPDPSNLNLDLYRGAELVPARFRARSFRAHRSLTHSLRARRLSTRSFKVPRWLTRTLTGLISQMQISWA
jgi:uncharacterized protein YjbI with pentapeptide repeats